MLEGRAGLEHLAGLVGEDGRDAVLRTILIGSALVAVTLDMLVFGDRHIGVTGLLVGTLAIIHKSVNYLTVTGGVALLSAAALIGADQWNSSLGYVILYFVVPLLFIDLGWAYFRD